MKRLLALAMAISIASCDSSMKAADGTSSETQTSLRMLATRLDGIRMDASISSASAVAGRNAQEPACEYELEDTAEEYESVAYLKLLGRPREFSWTRVRDSITASSSTHRLIDWLSSDIYVRHEWRQRAEFKLCADPKSWPSISRQEIVIAPVYFGHRTRFRNGVVIVPIDSSGSFHGYTFDDRWMIRWDREKSIADSGYGWWEVIENGKTIGYTRQKPVYTSDIDWYSTLLGAKVYDLQGVEVPPDRATPQNKVVFPEDSLGLSIDSIGIDSSKASLRLNLSWRFLPSAQLPIGESVTVTATLTATLTNTPCVLSGSCSNVAYTQMVIPSIKGRQSLEFELHRLDLFDLTVPSVLRVEIYRERDSLVGTPPFRHGGSFRAVYEADVPAGTVGSGQSKGVP